MKYAIIAALFVFALAQGSLAQDASQDLAQVTQVLEDMKNKMTEEVNKLLQTDFSNQAQTWIESSKTQLEAMAPQMQEQMKGLMTTMEEQMKPLQAQMQPMMENLQKQMEGIFQKLTEQAQAIAN
uniref:Uncharacterized protein n=1 Tax=Neogobius melanostomus TaxID=47308 RepID=A0A8C6WFW1_9GOBI